MQISSDAAASLTQEGVGWAAYGGEELFEEKLEFCDILAFLPLVHLFGVSVTQR